MQALNSLNRLHPEMPAKTGAASGRKPRKGPRCFAPCRQALLGQKLTRKYRRELGDDLAAACQAVENKTGSETGILTIS